MKKTGFRFLFSEIHQLYTHIFAPMRFGFILFSCLFFSLPSSGLRAASLLVRIFPEYRQEAENQSPAWKKFWQQYGLQSPRRCFPGHPALNQKEAESGFGPADLSLWYRLEVPEPMKSAFFIHQVRKHPFIRIAEWKAEDAVPLSMPDDPAADSASGPQRQVLRLIRAYEAWAISKGDSNVVIGLLDTGTPVLHEDLAASIKRNFADPPNGTDDDGNGLTDDFQGWDFGSNDNDPTPDNPGTSPGHGTSVSSLASASTDNGTGIAGIGWKCKILPVKIWRWSGNFSNFSGYEAIVYAADMGCRVINCSWGSPRAGTQYEQDIIRYATFNKGALVVAAGGNTPGYYQFLPANYDYAFGVSMTDTSDRIFWAASRHFKLDLMAPGVEVFGIRTDGTYGWVEGGTSMASPLVAGAAGLVLSRFPELNGLQAGELLRVNSDTIYSIPGNAGYRDQTGRGRLNILRALNRENRISLRAVSCIPKGLARPGDSLRLALRFENYLDSVSAFSVRLTSASPDFRLVDSVAAFGPLGGMQELTSAPVFRAVVSPQLNAPSEISLKAEVQAGNYRDVRWFTLTLNPGWLTLDSNEVRISLAENGRLGTADLAGYQGDGIRYRGVRLSSDAGLMLATGPQRVSNCVFGSSGADQHFRAENRPDFYPFPPLSQHTYFHFNDSLAGNQTLGLGLKQSAFECTADSLKSVVFISYQIKNRTANTIDSLYAGLYNDWDIDIPDLNFCRWTDSLQMGYTQGRGIRNLLAGTMLLGGGEPQFYAIDAVPDTSGGNINLYDGFSPAEKWRTLSSGIARPQAGAVSGNNVVQVTAAAIRNLKPGETRKVAFALVFGDSLKDLAEKAGKARSFFRQLNSSPAPQPLFSSFCDGDTLLSGNPAGINRVKVYRDSTTAAPVFFGNDFEANIFSDSSLFLAGADSLTESRRVRWQWKKDSLPDARFSCSNCLPGDTVESPFLLHLQAASGSSSAWYLNDSLLSVFSGADSASVYLNPSDSIQEICLEKTDSLSGCKNRFCRSFTLNIVTRTNSRANGDGFELCRMGPEELLLRTGTEGLAVLTGLQGKNLREFRLIKGSNRLLLQALPAGIYLLRCQSEKGGKVFRLQHLPD